jgi:hypothetical protein
MGPLPRFLHALTAFHAVGACAYFVMTAGSAASDRFREALAVSGGSKIMVAWFGAWTWCKSLLFIGIVLAILAYASWRGRPWAWLMTLIVYGAGICGGLWQVSVEITQGWVAASVNAEVSALRAAAQQNAAATAAAL